MKKYAYNTFIRAFCRYIFAFELMHKNKNHKIPINENISRFKVCKNESISNGMSQPKM